MSPRHLLALRAATDVDFHCWRVGHELGVPLVLSEALDEAACERAGRLSVARECKPLLEAQALVGTLAKRASAEDRRLDASDLAALTEAQVSRVESALVHTLQEQGHHELHIGFDAHDDAFVRAP